MLRPLSEADFEALNRLLDELRGEAERAAFRHNRTLPKICPNCDADPHVAGLPCHKCEYVHPEPWHIIRPTEWGYAVRTLGKKRTVIRIFSLQRHR